MPVYTVKIKVLETLMAAVPVYMEQRSSDYLPI